MPCNLAKIEVLDRGFLIDPGGYTTLPVAPLLFTFGLAARSRAWAQWASRDLRAPLGRLAQSYRKVLLGDDLCWLMRIISEGPGGFTTTADSSFVHPGIGHGTPS